MSNSAHPSTKRLAVWAINPFEVETRPGSAVIDELETWLGATGTAVQPVHVLGVPAAVLSPDAHGSWSEPYLAATEKETAEYLNGIGLPQLLQPKVLLHHGGTAEGAARVLLDYAQEVGAAWILVSSKGRSGLRRLALGSFAESLILTSPVPVWVFGHGNPAVLDPRRIIFSTDFSEMSRAAFNRVLDQASKLGARVTLFHCVNFPDGALSNLGMMGMTPYIPPEDYLSGQMEFARKSAADWIKDAAQLGVQVDFVVKEVVPNIDKSILQEAEAIGAGVIALASHSGRVSAAILGSHARQVVRHSDRPVWVFGPKCAELTATGDQRLEPKAA